MDPSYSITMIVLALFFVFLNGFFVLSEFCIVKVRKSKLEEFVKDGKKNARLALEITHNLDTYLSATQLGITLSSLALGWLGEPAVSKLIEPLFAMMGLDAISLHSVSFVVAFIFITLLHVVLGELVPKSVAISKAETSVLIIARPLYLFRVFFAPFIKTFDLCSAFILKRILGIEPASESELAHSEEEIKYIATESRKGGVLDEFETEIIQNAVDFSDIVAKEIMTPRKDMICLNKQKSFEENMQVVYSAKHTRFPYIDGSKDVILGMIHIRDLIERHYEKKEDTKVSSLDDCVRKMIIVPENISISKVLLMMNKEQIHTALVIDEYGGTAGLLTMEDIIEEIIGDISDEHDVKDVEYKKLADNIYEVNGRLDIESVEDLLGFRYSKDLEEVTIGGYVFNLLGHLPEEKERVEDEHCYYEVKKMKENAIVKLKIVKKGNN